MIFKKKSCSGWWQEELKGCLWIISREDNCIANDGMEISLDTFPLLLIVLSASHKKLTSLSLPLHKSYQMVMMWVLIIMVVKCLLQIIMNISIIWQNILLKKGNKHVVYADVTEKGFLMSQIQKTSFKVLFSNSSFIFHFPEYQKNDVFFSRWFENHESQVNHFDFLMLHVPSLLFSIKKTFRILKYKCRKLGTGGR